MTTLARLNLLLFALLVAHILDHELNQPVRELPASGTAVGVAGFALVATSAVLAVRRRPHAPAAAVVAGGATALGVVFVHLFPAGGASSATPTGTSRRTRSPGPWPWRHLSRGRRWRSRARASCAGGRSQPPKGGPLQLLRTQ